TPPELSATTPMILPVLVCANAGAARTANNTDSSPTLVRRVMALIPPSLSLLPAVARRPRVRFTNEFRTVRAVGQIFRGQINQLRDVLDLRVVDPIPRVVRRVVVGMFAGVEHHHRHALDGERIVIAAREP